MTNEGLSLLTFSPKITLEHTQKSSQCLFWTNRNANKALETAVKVASTQGALPKQQTEWLPRMAQGQVSAVMLIWDMVRKQTWSNSTKTTSHPHKGKQSFPWIHGSETQSQDGIHLAGATPRKDSFHPSPHYTPSQETINRIYSHLQINSNSHLRMNHQKGTSATKKRKYLKKELQE